MAVDKVTVVRDTEEWIRLSTNLKKHFEANKELIQIEKELLYLIEYPSSLNKDEALVREYAKTLTIWAARAFKQNLRDYSDDLKLFQALCKKIYLETEIYELYLEILKEQNPPAPPSPNTADEEQCNDFTKLTEVYGIDLGTTNSCIAIIDESGKAIVKPNMEGANTTPSVVSYEEGSNHPFVGEVAKEALISDPTRTVAFIKREIGNDEFRNNCVIPDNPIKISAYILKKLVDDVNKLEGKYNKNVVITCPAYFGTKEREQTKQAGIVAGLNVLSIINEPTAAALSYGMNLKENATILVYDLGGGTFDVSILTVKQNEIEVVATGGDHRLGGVDWDYLLAKHIAKEANIEIDLESSNNLKIKNLLLLNAEKSKKALSVREACVVNIPYDGRTRRIDLTSSLFEQLTSILLEQTIEKTNEVIKIAKDKGYNKIDEFLLVGGSVRMPQIKKQIDKEFNCDAKIADPDMSVAKGAAIYGDSLIHPEGKKRITDTSPNSYGIGCYNDTDTYIVRNLIKAQTKVVESSALKFRTMYDNQSSISIEIYEGNSTENENEILDSVLLENLKVELQKPYPKDYPFELEFKRTSEGILLLNASIDDLKWAAKLNLKGVLDKEEIEKQKEEVKDIIVG